MKDRDDKADSRNIRRLMAAIAQLDSPAECGRFFADLCTPAELQSMADRWRVAQLVARGLPYREIHRQTGVSTATVTRVARTLARGQGGYRLALDRTGAPS